MLNTINLPHDYYAVFPRETRQFLLEIDFLRQIRPKHQLSKNRSCNFKKYTAHNKILPHVNFKNQDCRNQDLHRSNKNTPAN